MSQNKMNRATASVAEAGYWRRRAESAEAARDSLLGDYSRTIEGQVRELQDTLRTAEATILLLVDGQMAALPPLVAGYVKRLVDERGAVLEKAGLHRMMEQNQGAGGKILGENLTRATIAQEEPPPIHTNLEGGTDGEEDLGIEDADFIV
jgi:hypothetical protein